MVSVSANKAASHTTTANASSNGTKAKAMTIQVKETAVLLLDVYIKKTEVVLPVTYSLTRTENEQR